MLRSLTSDLEKFKAARFGYGLNIVLAERTKKAASQDSRNAVGKTSLIRVLDFLLGADARPDHVLRRPELESATFWLKFDLGSAVATAGRSGVTPAFVSQGDTKWRLNQWRQELGRELFGLQGYDGEPSYRSLIAFYLRDVANGAFSSPVETHKKQAALATQPALAWLFGLDTGLVGKIKEISAAEKNLRDLRKATRDPILGMTLGRARDLDAEIRTLRIEEEALTEQLSSFKVVERYSEYRAQADQLSRQIRALNDRLVLSERRLSDIDQAINQEDDTQPDHEYLEQVYDQVGLVLPAHVKRRFAEVEEFHASVINNRRRYLETERARLTEDIADDRERLARADEERSSLMRLLEAGGALATYQELQRQLGKLSGRLAELIERRETVDRWENANRHLQLRSAELEILFSSDLAERRVHIEEIGRTYSAFAYRIYGRKRPASLSIEPSKSGYKFTPTIGGDKSEGVRSMALFCFDLTLAVTAHRLGRGPNFLVHDSHLYDGVEGRQMASALNLASEVAVDEGLQYIVTLNSDDLEKAQREGFASEYRESARMTDAYDDGGLFGLRFN
ncbi:uncharacterized protein YydD (DUF2326 family) [Actinomadura pelletieri DSM 43383]|uniref:Uncharacterized protein YydD (DUF2326 family) n=1 Tax=Actinomadura pelletieri DSM 43383 TaxID=1120940 RepID=A0A495QZT8_9ACTN|nr:ABC-three component system protein [Actinomadura pelletieri]RKS79587.1 uncharacterized protein YydD (DUF2326 family) [Actinomadura pelletieri DSM 43383]